MTSQELFELLQDMAAKATVDPTLEAVVLVELSGSDPAQWTGLVGGGKLSLSEGRPEAADLTITSTTETAAGIYQKSLNPVMAFLTGKIKVQGDGSKVALLKKLIAGRKN